MIASRPLGFWIDTGSVGLSMGLCLASIFFDGSTSLALLILGAALFMPASIRLASRLSGRPIIDQSDPPEAKNRPMLEAVLRVALGSILVAQLLSPDTYLTTHPYLRVGEAAVAAALLGFGGFGLVSAIKRRSLQGQNPG
jgi:hypothetical protein